jgi:hypothetical protein
LKKSTLPRSFHSFIGASIGCWKARSFASAVKIDQTTPLARSLSFGSFESLKRSRVSITSLKVPGMRMFAASTFVGS